jgi:chemotaxis protein methyltransferase CheR
MLEIQLDDHTFGRFADLIRRATGIEYSQAKRNLLLNRLRRRLTALGLDSPSAYLQVLESGGSPHELREFLDAITTNETWFFRCARHFDVFRRAMRERDREVPEGQRIRIWSAASSTGAEAYSAAITLHEEFGGARVRARFEIHGTDLNQKVLMQAREGEYPELLLREVDEATRERWFERRPAPADSAQDALFRVREELKTNVTFARHNLLEAWTERPFDFVFLRNVMIYFDRPTKEAVLARMFDAVAPGGTLVLGESESLVHVEHGFVSGETSVLHRPAAHSGERPVASTRGTRPPAG